MPEFNEQLARNALKRIKENPAEWRQDDWRCESGMCFAGYVAMEAGARWCDDWSPAVRTPNGAYTHVQVFAQEVLGIDEYHGQKEHLFTSTNSISTLERLIDKHADT